MSGDGQPTTTQALNKAATVIKEGDLQTGKEILKWVLERDPNNTLAWLWMSRCAPTNEAKLECFNRVLAIDPTNRHGLEGVRRYGGGDKSQVSPAGPPASSSAPPVQDSSKQRSRIALWVALGGVLVSIVFCIGIIAVITGSSPTAGVAEDSPAPRGDELDAEVLVELPTEPPSPTDLPSPTSPPQPTATPEIEGLIKVGTHLVGTDIEPGIYIGLAGIDIFGSCYWARFSNLTGENDINANDNAVGMYYVEITASDLAFETACELLPIDEVPAPTEFPSDLMPGTYIVGRDIEPGRYRGEAGTDIFDSCYWARLSNVSGEGDILANDNAIGQYFIEVLPSDFAVQLACEISKAE